MLILCYNHLHSINLRPGRLAQLVERLPYKPELERVFKGFSPFFYALTSSNWARIGRKNNVYFIEFWALQRKCQSFEFWQKF
jgi:hypothetical protein